MASRACLDVPLGLVGPLGSGKRGSGGVFYFGNEYKNVHFSLTARPIRIKFGTRHHGNAALSDFASLIDPLPLERGWGRIAPRSGIFHLSFGDGICHLEMT